MNHLRSLLGAALLAWLAACGPGTGGTGTGETYSFGLEGFGARAGSVCMSTLASTLSCTDPTTGASASIVCTPTTGGALSCVDSTTGAGNAPATEAANGTLTVHFTDSATGSEVHMVIEGNTVVFEARCQGLRFDGAWGVTGASDGRFFGTYSSTAAPSAVPATLVIDAVPGKDGALLATLRQADDRALLGPVTLSRIETPVFEPIHCR